MFAEQRQERIMHILEEYNQVEVSSLTSILSASEATIRRDLEKLERAGLIHRTHGGAILVEKESPVLQAIVKKDDPREKVIGSIGKTAARIVSPKEVVAIGAGVLGMAMARHLDSELQCTIITNDARIMMELLSRQQQSVIMIGGMAHITDQAAFTSGEIAVRMLDEFNVNKVFLDVEGIEHGAGLTTKNLEQALIWKKLMGIAEETVILALPEAFGRREFVRLAPVGAAHRFVSCEEADEAYKKYFFEHGVPFHFGFDV